MRVALYPGSFDPITLGHLNVIERGLALFDRLIVAVAPNADKRSLLSVPVRCQLISESIQAPTLEVASFEGLLVNYARQRGVSTILRGLRGTSDFEFEFQLAHLNRRLGKGLETVFVMTGESHFFVSSKMVREIAALGGDIGGLVPPPVQRHIVTIPALKDRAFMVGLRRP